MKLIDVSHWQGNIDWSKVAKDGIQGAYIKATEGSAAGSAFVDNKMDANFKGATANGLHAGFYHYAKFVSVNDAIEEAKWFVKHIKGYKFNMPPMLDLEENHCGSDANMNKAAKAFMEHVEKEVGSVGLYSFGVFFADNVDKALLKKYAYWHARYANDPVNVKLNDIYLWQHSDKGKVNGISGPVDMNKVGGKFFTLDEKKANKPASKPIAKPAAKKKPAAKATTHTVKKGETLSGIAKKYGTTVNKLSNLNSIKNPNIIHPGDKLKLTGTVKKAPAKQYHTVKSGDTVSVLAVKYGTTTAKIKSLNNLANVNKIYAGQKLRVK
ncbi:GH25 family lysozyme [Virgibacillus halophilus]|uniref:GH25 family lysozyme n=1 Tax=Tigheibacillus halophilus TaxID=361280 RepID=A0ABU5C812_9BACI|nr:GH25 family lysozyme [Virgibacillus halophilus]